MDPEPRTDPRAGGPGGAGGPRAAGRRRGPSLGRASSLMAVASLVSRITGFVRQLALVSVLGLGVVNDSYTVANTLPNIVYELLLGGVLTSIMVPLLVRAQTEDADGGEAYTRRLLTVACAALAVATLAAMAAAPLLTRLYLGDDAGPADPALATAFAWLLLPQIFFYGLGALLGALLNTRGAFGPFAWAPVLNNVVVLAVLAVFVALPGRITLDPVRMGEPKLLLLGLGTTLGIVAQAVVLLPAVRRSGFRYRPLWGWDRRLAETGGLALWVVGYVLIGQVGYVVTTRVAAAAAPGSVAIYANAWLLLQVPYGVLGVSLLTALMPRMSRSAAEGRTADVVADLGLGVRLSALVLLPVSVLLTLFGPALGVALFSLGAAADGDGPARLGAALAASAFGLLPFAVTMLQLRVFYALTDSRTPTLLQLAIVGVKIPLLLAAGAVLPPERVVLGLAAANGLSFVVGAVLGQVVLLRRLGRLGTTAVLGALLRVLVASAVAGLAAWGAMLLARRVLPALGPVAGSWVDLGVAALVGLPVAAVAMVVLRVPELAALRGRLRRSARPA